MDNIKQLALETIKLNKQAIVFVPSRASAEKTAEELAKLSTSLHPNFEKEVLKVASTPTKQCRRLSHCIRKGVAFHHAGLIQKQKDLIESEFKNGKIKIICATPTLAAGLSLPVFRVIIKSLKRFSGKWGMDWITVIEYLQMAGRAGRPEYEKFGETGFLSGSPELLIEQPLNVFLQWFLIFEPKHPLLGALIENVTDAVLNYTEFGADQRPSGHIRTIYLTGPLRLTDTIWKTSRSNRKFFKNVRFDGIDYQGKAMFQFPGHSDKDRQCLHYSKLSTPITLT